VRVRGVADDNAAARNRYVPNIDKARRDLALQVSTPLEKAIRLTAAGGGGNFAKQVAYE
jgi:hypothetical protein